jgi:hypothetical protein
VRYQKIVRGMLCLANLGILSVVGNLGCGWVSSFYVGVVMEEEMH